MNAPFLVLFDMDGTLIDSQDHIVAAMGYAFDQVGLQVPARHDVLSIVGLSLPEAMEKLAPSAKPSVHSSLAEHYRGSFSAEAGLPHEQAPTQLYPGAREALDRLYSSRSAILGVATGKGKRGLDHVYRSLGLERYFRTSQTSDNHPSKPNPSMVYAALAETGCEATRSVMVGDTTYDMEMGKAAGLSTIGVSWGYHSRQHLWNAGADMVLEDFSEIDLALSRLFGETG